MLGRLTLEAFKHDAIEMGANVSMIFALLLAIGLLTYFRFWGRFWREWVISLDPKKIGIMYLVVSLVMLFKGLFEAAMMRAQQAFSVGESHGYLTSDHFQQLFTAHGTTMIFFVGMGTIFGVINLIMPLQIGARDVAFPFMNSLSFYLFLVGAFLVNLSLLVGNFSATGWVAYPPLSGLQYSPGVGVDYWIWSVQIAGIGSLLSGINFLVTIFKMRAPGMTLMRMPIFIWATLGAMILVIFAFPILTATLAMLSLDRLIGTHFFTLTGGGNPMLYVNLIWAWGHPEVYILMLPAFGIYSEVVPVFSSKRLFGYASMVWALAVIVFLSFVVWLHHFFTMGAGANVNAFFGIMTMLIAIPTGAKIFNWIFTMYGGRVSFATPMLWFLGFVIVFTTGGLTGVMMSIAPVDFQVHNSLYLIAHFHSMVIGGVLFGLFSGFSYWFPKFIGFKLNEKWGKAAFYFWITGFTVAFMPLYVLGLMGATRRLDHYSADTGWQPLLLVALLGALFVIVGMSLQVVQIFVSFKERKENLDVTGDPWNGRTLEWATSSPPAFYNWPVTPEVHGRDAFWAMKEARKQKPLKFEPIHMPKDTAMGLYIALFAFLIGFGLIWYMFWLAIIGVVGIIACLIIRLADHNTSYYIPVSEIEKIEAARLQ